MIDHFAILVSHGLLLLAAWRLLARDELDQEGATKTGWRKPRVQPEQAPDA